MIADSAYLNDILGQPAALQATLDALVPDPGLRAIARELNNGGYRQVVLTGMGSSFHALHPLHLRLIEAGHCSQMIETGELVHYAAGLFEPQTVIVAASQSGQSAEILRLLELARGRAALIGITNTPESALALQAKAIILTAAGPEFSVSCKTYLATLAGLAWLGDLLLESRRPEQTSHLATAPGLVARYLEGWQEYVSALSGRLQGVRHVFLLGRGSSLAAAGTGALIIKESARAHAEGMSCAAFRHGPLEMVSDEVFILVYQGAAATAAANHRLVEDIRAAGGISELACAESDARPFQLPPCSPEVLPFLEILPAQMISLALAGLKGIEPGRFRYASKVTTIE